MLKGKTIDVVKNKAYMLKHEIRITLRVEEIITKANECMSMECKPFVQLDV